MTLSLSRPAAPGWPGHLAVAAATGLLLLTGLVFAAEGTAPAGIPSPGGVLSTLCSAGATTLRPIERASLATPASGSGAPGGAPPASLLDLGSGLNWTAGATQCYAYPVTTVGSSLTLSEVGIEVKSFDCAPVSGVVAILFTDAHGQPVASENLRSYAWGSASASAPIVGEYLVLIARAPLLNDALVVQVPGSISSSAIAGSGAWEGCGF